MRLQAELERYIKTLQKKEVPLDERAALCKILNRMLETGERKLRLSPNVVPVKNKKSHITGYSWKEDK